MAFDDGVQLTDTELVGSPGRAPAAVDVSLARGLGVEQRVAVPHVSIYMCICSYLYAYIYIYSGSTGS